MEFENNPQRLPDIKSLRQKAGQYLPKEKPVISTIVESPSEESSKVTPDSNSEDDDDFLNKLKAENKELERQLRSDAFSDPSEKSKPFYDEASQEFSKEKRLSYRREATPQSKGQSAVSSARKSIPRKPQTSAVKSTPRPPKEEKVKQLELRLKGTMKSIQTLESQLADKQNYINSLERELEDVKRRPEPQSEPTYKQQHVSSTYTPSVKDKKVKELEKKCVELEERLGEMKRRNNRLEMLNDQLTEKLKNKAKEDEEKKTEVEALYNKLSHSKSKSEKLKNVVEKLRREAQEFEEERQKLEVEAKKAKEREKALSTHVAEYDKYVKRLAGSHQALSYRLFDLLRYNNLL